MLWKKQMILIVVMFVFIFGYVVFSDAVNTRYTEFYFVSGSSNYSIMSVDLTGGVTGHVSIGLENNSNTSFPVNISFVDSQIIDYGSTGVRVCLSENETQEVGQYIGIDNPSFSISANTGIVEQLDLFFPAWYSGLYYGCVVYAPNTSESSNYLNTVARKAIFLDINVESTYKDLDIVVRPAFRSDGGNSYGFSGADFWLFSYNGSVWNEIYNSAKGGDDKINTDGNGFATVSLLPPTDGSEYLVAFKGSGSLSIGYTGIWNDSISGFNMFSGIMANNMLNGFSIVYYDGSNTGNYLKMGDVVSNNSGNYDLIKDSDFAMMTYSLTTILNPSHPDWFDLDGNNVINALEQTMVTDSYNHVGFISLQNDIPLSDFVNI